MPQCIRSLDSSADNALHKLGQLSPDYKPMLAVGYDDSQVQVKNVTKALFLAMKWHIALPLSQSINRIGNTSVNELLKEKKLRMSYQQNYGDGYVQQLRSSPKFKFILSESLVLFLSDGFPMHLLGQGWNFKATMIR